MKFRGFFCLLIVIALIAAFSCPVFADDTEITVTDQAGREVVFDSYPQRIVSGYYISTSALIALGVQDRLVGIEAKAAERNIYRLAAPELPELPNTGTAKVFNLEGCIAMDPELVILPLRLRDAGDTLETLGISVLYVNPESQEQLEEMITLLAAATGTAERGNALLGFIEDCRGLLTEKLSGLDRKPTIYIAGNSSLLSTAGSGMFQSAMAALAGADNVAAELSDSYWQNISYEQLLAWDPEYILLPSGSSATAEDVMNDPRLAGCSAVKYGNILTMPDEAESWDSPVPGGILGSVWLASALHGDLVSPEQSADLISAFYRTFYGFAYYGDAADVAA